MMKTHLSLLHHLKALRAFEAAARHQSFKSAAGELGVTESAVSRMIRQLESMTGQQLFDRLHRGVRLSDRGKTLFDLITPAFDGLRAASTTFLSAEALSSIVIAAPAGFISRCLIPRLPALKERFADTDVHLMTWDSPPDPNVREVNCYIGVGRPGTLPWLKTVRLFPEAFGLVVSPENMRKIEKNGNGFRTTLAKLVPRNRPGIWDDWITESGIAAQTAGPIFLERVLFAIEAAEAGLGLTVAPHSLVQGSLKAGTLCLPFGWVRRSGFGFLSMLRIFDRNPRMTVLSNWFHHEFRALRDDFDR